MINIYMFKQFCDDARRHMIGALPADKIQLLENLIYTTLINKDTACIYKIGTSFRTDIEHGTCGDTPFGCVSKEQSLLITPEFIKPKCAPGASQFGMSGCAKSFTSGKCECRFMQDTIGKTLLPEHYGHGQR